MDSDQTTSAAVVATETASQRLGHALSVVLHPLALGTPIAIGVGVREFGGFSFEVFQVGAIVGTLGLLFPLALLFLLVRTGKISDLFMTRHEDRRWVYPIGFADLLFIFFVFWAYEAPQTILATVAAGFLAVCCMAIGNRFLKASIHCAGNAGILLALCWVEGWLFSPLLLLIPATIWSRLAVREHTPAEALAGTILGILPTAAAMAFFLGPPVFGGYGR